MANLLIVDDVEMIRDSLEATLTRAGHEVTSCMNALEALAHLKQHSYEMIITDLKMPKMDGLAFLEELGKLGI